MIITKIFLLPFSAYDANQLRDIFKGLDKKIQTNLLHDTKMPSEQMKEVKKHIDEKEWVPTPDELPTLYERKKALLEA